MESIRTILSLIATPVATFWHPWDRMAYVYLIPSILIALITYVVTRQKTVRGFFAFCFPKSIYLHKSALLDYKYFYINAFLALFPLGITLWLSGYCNRVLQDFFYSLGAKPIMIFTHYGSIGSLTFSILFTIALGLAYDFGLYLSHYMMHMIPWLWEFHKVHHSAEVLTPITVRRMHPTDDLISYSFAGFFVALVDSILRCFIGGPVAVIKVFSINLLFFVFYFLGYHARHSHVWIDYGKTWDKIIISPAQHQIHHSAARRHWNKNMGFIFAIWDRMFGTLYVPEKKENLSFGLSASGKSTGYHSLARLYLLPVIRMFGHMHGRPVALNLCFLLILPFVFSPLIASALDKSKPNVFIEDLTSSKVQGMIACGYTRVLVPTGGIEQSGSNMVLGKHNYIVKETSEKIALRAGHMLVAPVVPYTVCGDIDPPTDLMCFAGSISLTKDAFASVLDCVAKSLKQSGFKEIYFLGDHGPSQKIQDEVAERLTRQWNQPGQKDVVKVTNLSDYYLANSQYMSLIFSGWSPQRIGTHAGIRDTSELMAVHPQGVWQRSVLPLHLTDASSAQENLDGATPNLGRKMIDMKVRAAVQQILCPERTATHINSPSQANSDS